MLRVRENTLKEITSALLSESAGCPTITKNELNLIQYFTRLIKDGLGGGI
jgi:hypothetical protein